MKQSKSKRPAGEKSETMRPYNEPLWLVLGCAVGALVLVLVINYCNL